MKTRIALLLFLPMICTITAHQAMAEMKQNPPYKGVVTDIRNSDVKEDDRYWFGKEDEEEFERYSDDTELEEYRVVDDPDFSNAHWGPWTMEKDKNDVITFKKHPGTTLLFYGNPLVLETISATPLGADLHFGERVTEEELYEVEDKLLLRLKGEKPAKKKEGEEWEEEKKHQPIIIRNEYPGGYEYQTVRKYTDVGVWVVMRPR